MKCPVCDTEMVEKDFGRGVMVDVCAHGCQGIWFDWFELQKLDETSEGCGEALNAALNTERSNDAERGQIPCPKCHIPMYVHKYKEAKEVSVDECYKCGGFFLDAGELQAIRDNFMTDDESDAYFQKLVDSVPEFEKAEMSLEKQKERCAALRKYTKFLCLSYYLNRKKD